MKMLICYSDVLQPPPPPPSSSSSISFNQNIGFHMIILVMRGYKKRADHETEKGSDFFLWYRNIYILTTMVVSGYDGIIWIRDDNQELWKLFWRRRWREERMKVKVKWILHDEFIFVALRESYAWGKTTTCNLFFSFDSFWFSSRRWRWENQKENDDCWIRLLNFLSVFSCCEFFRTRIWESCSWCSLTPK